MEIIRAVEYISTFIWLFPPIRQYKGNYFYFFLVLALIDPISDAVYSLTAINPMRMYAACTLYLIFGALRVKLTKPNLFYILVFSIIDFYLSLSLSYDLTKLYLVFLLTILFFIILRKTVICTFDKGQINLFYFILTLYLISVITKILITFTQFNTGVFYFYITTAFEILVALYFIFYNEINSPKFKLNK